MIKTNRFSSLSLITAALQSRPPLFPFPQKAVILKSKIYLHTMPLTKNAMERLVEDLIQESMAKGDFDNLKGSGKPLPQRVIYNPYEDYTTYKVTNHQFVPKTNEGNDHAYWHNKILFS